MKDCPPVEDSMTLCAYRTSIAGEFESLQDKDFENMLRTNVLGSVYPTHAVVPLMKRQRSGRIVFVSSQVAQAALHGKNLNGSTINFMFSNRIYSICRIKVGFERLS